MSDSESFKVVLVGESGVGKTSIITQFIDQTFQEDQQSTTGGTFSTKSVKCDGKTLKFEIWDTAGQERYRSLTKMFYKDANAAVLVYDITRKGHFLCHLFCVGYDYAQALGNLTILRFLLNSQEV